MRLYCLLPPAFSSYFSSYFSLLRSPSLAKTPAAVESLHTSESANAFVIRVPSKAFCIQLSDGRSKRGFTLFFLVSIRWKLKSECLKKFKTLVNMLQIRANLVNLDGLSRRHHFLDRHFDVVSVFSAISWSAPTPDGPTQIQRRKRLCMFAWQLYKRESSFYQGK